MTPLKKRSFKAFHEVSAYQPMSKKILIEKTTALLVITFAIFKTTSILLPETVDLSSLLDLLVSLPSILRLNPALSGMLLSFITWHIMYLDSAVPGINPPTPLSPVKYRAMSGADFHLNYLFAIFIGPLVTTIMYLK